MWDAKKHSQCSYLASISTNPCVPLDLEHIRIEKKIYVLLCGLSKDVWAFYFFLSVNTKLIFGGFIEQHKGWQFWLGLTNYYVCQKSLVTTIGSPFYVQNVTRKIWHNHEYKSQDNYKLQQMTVEQLYKWFWFYGTRRRRTQPWVETYHILIMPPLV